MPDPIHEWSPHKRAVLVPFDYSPAGLAALDAAGHFVADPAHVAVLHVGANDAVLQRQEEADRLARVVADAGYGYTTHVAHGAPAEAIVAFAQRQGVELVVMPSRGRGGVTRLLMGSVAEAVTREAGCPVLVLRPVRNAVSG